jgi:hypothetical protein
MIRLRDLRGMTEDSDSLSRRLNMAICSGLRDRTASETRVRVERLTG